MKRLIVICVLILVAVSPAFADCSSADRKMLEEYDRAWGDASLRGDRAALEGMFATDYMNLSVSTPQNKKEAIDTTIRDFERAKSESNQPTVTHDYYLINCSPTTATITHRNTLTTMRNGKPDVSYSRSIHVVEKRNGKWQAVSNAGNPLSDSATIAYMEKDWATSDLTGDATWLDRNLADDYVGISSRTGKVSTKSQEVNDMRARKQTVTGADNLNMDIRMLGDDNALVTGSYRFQGKEQDGKPFDRMIAYTDVWVKRDGRWQVLSSQGTPVVN